MISWIYDASITQQGINMVMNYIPEFVVESANKIDEVGDKTLEHTEHRIVETRESLQYYVHKTRDTAVAGVSIAEHLVVNQVHRVLDITDTVVDTVLPEGEMAAAGTAAPAAGTAAPQRTLTRVSDTVHRVKSRAVSKATAVTTESKQWLSVTVKNVVPAWALESGELSIKWTENVMSRANNRASEMTRAVRDTASAAKLKGSLTGMKNRSDQFITTLKSSSKSHINGSYLVIHDWMTNTYNTLMDGMRNVKTFPASQSALAWSAMQYQMVHDVLARAADVGADSLETSMISLRDRAGTDKNILPAAMRTVADILEMFVSRKRHQKPMDALMQELKHRQMLINPSVSPLDQRDDDQASSSNPTAYEEHAKDQ
jgi:hypothetical protein